MPIRIPRLVSVHEEIHQHHSRGDWSPFINHTSQLTPAPLLDCGAFAGNLFVGSITWKAERAQQAFSHSSQACTHYVLRANYKITISYLELSHFVVSLRFSISTFRVPTMTSMLTFLSSSRWFCYSLKIYPASASCRLASWRPLGKFRITLGLG